MAAPLIRVAAQFTCASMLVLFLAACHEPKSTDVEVEIRSVGLDQASHSPVVVLQDKAKQRAFPIWIGPAEAQAIAMQMEGIHPPRPMTHDLMKQALEQSGVEFDRVLISDMKESTYYARIMLRSGRKEVELDSRPSDAIALAVRFNRPIFVTQALLDKEIAIDLRSAALTEGAITLNGVTLQDLTADLATYFDLPAGAGVLVSDVRDDAQVALKRGDIITDVDGAAVSGVAGLQAQLTTLRSGESSSLAVRRGSDDLHVEFRAGE